jgi:DtxR family Mn-dependent transcriptional regulator
VLKDFLLNVLQIDEETADATACRMEYVIDKKTVERLVCFIEYVNTCPRAGKEWLDSFINFCKTDETNRQKCQRCIDDLKNAN